MFFKHFANKNQLPGLCVSGTLVENGLNLFHLQTKSGFNKNVLVDTQFFSRINRKSIKRFADYVDRFHLITPFTYFLPWCLSIHKKNQKTSNLPMFSGGIDRNTGMKWVKYSHLPQYWQYQMYSFLFCCGWHW